MYPTPNWEIPMDIAMQILDALDDSHMCELLEESPWLLRDILILENITVEVLTDLANDDFLQSLNLLLIERGLVGCERYLEVWLEYYHEQGKDCLLGYMSYVLFTEIEEYFSESV